MTGMEVREATAVVEPASGAVVQAFTTGNVVQVFQLAGSVHTDTWSGNQAADPKGSSLTNLDERLDHD